MGTLCQGQCAYARVASPLARSRAYTQSWIVRPLDIYDYARVASPLALSEGSRPSEILDTHTAYVQASSTSFGNR